MAKATSVWGLEIGQSAFKALKCRLDGEQVVAEAFDYIEYPKILSQPESDAETLVREALETFVSRNDLKHTRVAVSVPGQNGLAKFFKPPPVELKKIPDIVRYEAKQQIPFELDDVVWDYQLMGGGEINDGFAMESEVGLFAMKRDAVYRALAPLRSVDLEVDVLQLAPLSIYNMVTYDQSLADDLTMQFDSENPPKSTVVLAMGTDATDLIVTNGYRVWQRSMPLGGNHFTRQLTKDLKLTFTKAEHLKRNAMEADDPKLIFQAMRPIFNDLVTEVQRSMGFFRSLNKNAEIGSILMLGNSVKLPGLSQYLSKNLAMDVEVLDSFSQLSGDEVVSAPAFKDHLATFGPVYGLCLQALNKGPTTTNLIPKEVMTERLVRSKKPWAVAAASLLLMGLSANLLAFSSRYDAVHPEEWSSAITAAENMKKKSDTNKSADTEQMNRIALLQTIGEEVGGTRDRRLLWLEMIDAINQSLGRPDDYDVLNLPDPEKVPYKERTELFITKVDSRYYEDISTYLTDQVKALYDEDFKSRMDAFNLLKSDDGEEGETEDAATTTDTSTTTEEGDDPSGIVVELTGYHYHNGDEYAPLFEEREGYVLKTLIERLENGSAVLPLPEGGTMEFTYKELGISYPFVLRATYNADYKVPNPKARKKSSTGGPGGDGIDGAGGMGGMGAGGMGGMGAGGMGGMGGGMGGGAGNGGTQESDSKEPEIPLNFDAPRLDFVVQFIWKPQPITPRIEAKKLAEEQAALEAAEAAEAAAAEGEDTFDETAQ